MFLILYSVLCLTKHVILGRDGTRRKSLRPGRLTQKDRRLLKMILVIFVSFLVCYLPITIVKVKSFGFFYHLNQSSCHTNHFSICLLLFCICLVCLFMFAVWNTSAVSSTSVLCPSLFKKYTFGLCGI